MSKFDLYRNMYASEVIDVLKTYSENHINIWESYFDDKYSIIYVNRSDTTPIPYIKIYPKLGLIREDNVDFGDSLRIYIFNSIPLCPFPFCGTIMIHKFTDKTFIKKYTLSCFLFRPMISFNKKKFIKLFSNSLKVDIDI
jgi:hypothetical protein